MRKIRGNRVPIELTIPRLIGVIGSSAITSATAVTLVSIRSSLVLAAALVSVVIIATTATVALLAVGRTAGTRRLEGLMVEIGRALPDLKTDSHRNAQLVAEILDALRSITAKYDDGGGGGNDSGPNPLHVAHLGAP